MRFSRQIYVALAFFPFLFHAEMVIAQEPTFSSQSNVVIVPALVRDTHGKAVYGLQAKDFSIDDDGVEQTVHLDEAADAEPVSVVVAVQTGRRAMREFPRIHGLSAMLQPIFGQPNAKIALVEFDSNVNLIQDFTSTDGLIEEDLKQLQSRDDGAAILDAVDYSVKLLETLPKGRQRVLLLISETRDHGSQRAKIEDVITAIGNSNTVVYALPFSPSLSQVLDTERGSNRDEMQGQPDLLAPLIMAAHAMRKNIPKAIASMTGGEYELFSSRKSFETRMTSFSNHLHSRYLLSFEPKNPHPGLHEIRVRLKEAGTATVLARASYWVREPE
ncbi:MAG TPA: VWA domain-containing protein [Terriglobales bacterium]|nr:VWA domain-containing protein [Terriglobales bacterium]